MAATDALKGYVFSDQNNVGGQPVPPNPPRAPFFISFLI